MVRRPVTFVTASTPIDRQAASRGSIRAPLIIFLLSALFAGLIYSYTFVEDDSPTEYTLRKDGREISVVSQKKQDVPAPSLLASAVESHVAEVNSAAATLAPIAAPPPPSLPVTVSANAAPMATVEDLGKSLGIVKASSRTWNVVAGTPWFGGAHPWARGPTSCPGGCSINWVHDQGRHEADILLVHGDAVTRAPQTPHHDKQLIALWASETFDLPTRGPHGALRV